MQRKFRHFFFLTLCLTLFLCFGCNRNVRNSSVKDAVSDDREKENADYYRSVYETGKKISDDYIGTVFFDNDMIEEPVVQGQDNSYYLHTDWKSGAEDETGTVFLDYENSLSDQNLILYGHFAYPSVDPKRTVRFTPLQKLLQDGREREDGTVYFLVENEIRQYEIAAVCIVDLDCDSNACYPKDTMPFNRTSFDEETFTEYHQEVQKRKLYDTGKDFSYEDHLLTLQTCVEGREDEREIVIARLVHTFPVTDVCSFAKRTIPPAE